MVYKSISTSEITLGWEEPLDYGGYSDISYVVERKQTRGNEDWTELASASYKRTYKSMRLTENKEYQFRIWAENDCGRSKEPLVGKPVVAKNQFTVPGQPTNLCPDDITKNSISLVWNAPRSDGGRPITSYVVEKQGHDSTRWSKCSRSNILATKCVIDNLMEGESYKFRVYAVNDAGPGEPCQAPKAYRIKPMRAKPTIDLSGKLNQVHVKVGERIYVNLLYEASPLPTVDWKKNGELVEKSSRVDILEEEYRTRLAIEDAARSDSGLYEVLLANEFGQETYRANVVVMDTPSQPRGPLEVSEITNESVVLNWKVPEDNGGSEITSYIIERQDLDKRMWAKAGTVVNKTTFQANKLIDNHRYMFRVFAENACGLSKPLEGEPVEAKNPYDAPGSPHNLSIYDMTPSSLNLKWEKPRSDGGNKINGYIVEYREVNSARWIRACRALIGDTQFTVNDLLEGESYEFRVSAENFAGAGTPCEATEPVLMRSPYGEFYRIRAPLEMIKFVFVQYIRQKKIRIEIGEAKFGRRFQVF